jgi:hypothetical protein
MIVVVEAKNGVSSLSAFVPFAPFTVSAYHNSMALKWSFLFTALEAISLLSFYLNLVMNDFFWCLLSIFAYIMVAAPLCFSGVKTADAAPQNLTFSRLFRACTKAVFADYRISLMSRIPLVLQVLTGGSLLYEFFGPDWIMHALGGFGVGALAWRAYVAGTGQFGYGRLVSYFHVDKIPRYRTEPKTAPAEFTLFSVTVIALAWEIFERIVYFASPDNMFRVGMEPLWNIIGDIAFGIAGGMIACYILTRKTKWK